MPQQTAFPLIIILGLCLAGPLACQPSEPWTSSNPEFALNAFLTAMAQGDFETAREFVSPATLAFLDDNQRAVLETLGPDSTPADPLLGLYRVWTPSAIDIDRVELLEQSDTLASLAIHTIFGQRSTVTLTRAADRWTIDLVPVAPNPPQTAPVQSP